jgi:hypothetical protein
MYKVASLQIKRSSHVDGRNVEQNVGVGMDTRARKTDDLKKTC